MDQAYTSSRRMLLTDFRSNEAVGRLIARGVIELQTLSAPASPQQGF